MAQTFVDTLLEMIGPKPPVTPPGPTSIPGLEQFSGQTMYAPDYSMMLRPEEVGLYQSMAMGTMGGPPSGLPWWRGGGYRDWRIADDIGDWRFGHGGLFPVGDSPAQSLDDLLRNYLFGGAATRKSSNFLPWNTNQPGFLDTIELN